MAQRVDPKLCDEILLESVRVEIWAEVADSIGGIAGWDEKSHESLVVALRTKAQDEQLHEVLTAIAEFSKEGGKELLAKTFADQLVPISGDTDDDDPAEVAVRACLLALDDDRAAVALQHAYFLVTDLREARKCREFAGKAPLPFPDFAAKKALLHERLLEWTKESGRGDFVRVSHLPNTEFEHAIHIVRASKQRHQSEIEEGSHRRRRVRLARGEMARYHADTGRLTLYCYGNVVDDLKRVLGEVLFDDEDFFADERVCSLDVVQKGGRDALMPHRHHSVRFVDLVELEWTRGDGERIGFKSTDCFRTLDDLKLVCREGRWTSAKLKMTMLDSSARPATVTIRVPNEIDFKRNYRERAIEEYLDDVGIRSTTTSRTETLWTLAPWRHPYAVWRRCFGAGTDTLITEGVLQPCELGSVPDLDYPDSGRVLEVRTFNAESTPTYFGVSDDGRRIRLNATQVEGYSLDIAALIRRTGRALNLSPAVPSAAEPLVELGSRNFGQSNLQFVLVLQDPTNRNWQAEIATLRRNSHLVLLVPRGCSLQTDQPSIEVDLSSDLSSLLSDALREVGPVIDVPAIERAHPADRFVLDVPREVIWIDGLRIAASPDEHPYRFISFMLQNAYSDISHEEIGEFLSPGRSDPSGAARSAKRRAKALVHETFSANNRPLPVELEDPFKGKKTGCYRVDLKCLVE